MRIFARSQFELLMSAATGVQMSETAMLIVPMVVMIPASGTTTRLARIEIGVT